MFTLSSYREGFFLTNKNINFLFISFISVISSKLASNSLLESKDFFVSFYNLLKESTSLTVFHQLRQIEFINIVHLYIFSSILFLISFATIIGLNGIIKDLLIDRVSNIKKIYKYAKKFFWTCFKYKFLIYVFLALIFLVSFIVYYSLYMKIGFSLFYTICSLLLVSSIFVIIRAFSSLGVKYIILKNERNILNVFYIVRNLFIRNKSDVFIFFIISTTIAFLTFGIPIIISFYFGIISEYSIVFLFLILSYFTAFLKLSSYIFFLNLYNEL